LYLGQTFCYLRSKSGNAGIRAAGMQSQTPSAKVKDAPFGFGLVRDGIAC